MLLPTCVTMPISVTLDETMRAYNFEEDPPEKIGLLVSRFSRSLKVIGIVTDRSATYDFQLVIRSNHVLFPTYRKQQF